MAKLIPCKTCGKMIASSAKTCPQCGAKNKKLGGCAVLLIIVLIIIVFSAMFGESKKTKPKADEIQQQAQKEQQQLQEQRKHAEEEKAALAAMTPEQRSEYSKEQRRQSLARQFASKFERTSDGSIRPVVEFIKSNMNNPDSFTHVKTNWFINKDVDKQYIVRMQYRGTNGFGAIVTETAEMVIDQDGNIIKTPSR